MAGILLIACAVLLIRSAWKGWDWKDQGFTNRLLVALTAAYVAATFLQWAAMRSALKLTRESNALMQRAWLIVDDIGVAAWYQDILDIGFTVTNVGKIPATQIQIADYSNIYPERNAPWPLPVPPVGGLAEATIGPGYKQRFTVKSCATTMDQRDTILHATASLAVGLAVSYTDVIGSEGLTKVNGFFDGRDGEWKYAPAGNAVI